MEATLETAKRYTNYGKMFLVLFLTVLMLYQICSARPCILLCTSINRKNIHWERLVSTGIFFLYIAKKLQFSKSEQTFNHRWLLTSPITLTLNGHNTIKLFAKCLEVFGRCQKCYKIKTSIWIWKLLTFSELDWNFLWAGPSSSLELDDVFQGNPWKKVSVNNILVLILTNQLLNKFTSM